MRVFAIGIEHALDVAVQRPQDADPSEHLRPATRRDEYQRLHRVLPFRHGVLGLWKLGDIIASVLERHKLSAAGRTIGSSKGRDQPFSRIGVGRIPVGADVGATFAASLAGEPRLDV
jgi:hypothetical protein